MVATVVELALEMKLEHRMAVVAHLVSRDNPEDIQSSLVHECKVE